MQGGDPGGGEMKPLPLYWLRTSNFGDILNPILYRGITGHDPEWADHSPKIVAVGSVMSAAGPGDIVWGAGCISENTPLKCDATTEFRVIRGPLSAEVLKKHGIQLPERIIFGSPCNLIPLLFPLSSEKLYHIGFIPHYIDLGQVKNLPADVKLLSTATEPMTLIKQIVSCDAIISSSLHGIILAEAYGIPAVWVKLSDKIVGGEFKFRDYYAGTGRTMIPMDWRNGYNWNEARSRIHQAGIYCGWINHLGSQILDSCPFKEGHL